MIMTLFLKTFSFTAFLHKSFFTALQAGTTFETFVAAVLLVLVSVFSVSSYNFR